MAGSTVIDEQQIMVITPPIPTGNAKEFKVKFVLNKPNIRIPSYFGKFFKFTYYIEVILKKNILYEVTKTYEIVFLDPESMALASNYTKTEKIDFRPITFDLILDHTQYSTQDNITGLIKFPKNELSGIESIDISISLKETLRGSKSNEEEILRYQVVDGCPMPGSNISFIIQLAPYQLWVTKFDNSNKLNAQYFLHVLLSRHGKDGTYVENVCNVALNLIYKKLENKGKKY
ncbi:hypothetical protein GPJ56_004829 [Histomonas meleagridis]|uniref:uncharacterized protein n=1 Tax=Histomonas meleagridis TaxID=135588 RepID=UPI003559C036|nr:hypothetical protein GPJ56_004829 [Histomonas meleagridis]KAH0803480.1 hypothetical protein GO595_003824 [Histomonas meleagridis]